MPVYLISYDLATPTNYEPLTSALKNQGATPVLFSEWILTSTASIGEVYDFFWRFRTTDEDRFLVVQIANWCTEQKNLLTPMPPLP